MARAGTEPNVWSYALHPGVGQALRRFHPDTLEGGMVWLRCRPDCSRC